MNRELYFSKKQAYGISDGDILVYNGVNYKVIEKIDEGGMASIHLSRKQVKNEIYPDFIIIKKFLDRNPDRDQNFCRKYWKNECRISAIQNSSPTPHIRYLGSLCIENTANQYEFYLFLEYIKGKKLHDWYFENFLPNIEFDTSSIAFLIKNILFPLISHLEFVHNNCIIHRDITASNILIIEWEDLIYPILIDWGVAKKFQNISEISHPPKPYIVNSPKATSIINQGTPPEIIFGCQPVINSDIYMLGAIMYLLFSKKRPYIYCIEKESFVLSPRKENPSLPHTLDNIVKKSTAYEPADRYSSMKELESVLKNFLREINDLNVNSKNFNIHKEFFELQGIFKTISAQDFKKLPNDNYCIEVAFPINSSDRNFPNRFDFILEYPKNYPKKEIIAWLQSPKIDGNNNPLIEKNDSYGHGKICLNEILDWNEELTSYDVCLGIKEWIRKLYNYYKDNDIQI